MTVSKELMIEKMRPESHVFVLYCFVVCLFVLFLVFPSVNMSCGTWKVQKRMQYYDINITYGFSERMQKNILYQLFCRLPMV